MPMPQLMVLIAFILVEWSDEVSFSVILWPSKKNLLTRSDHVADLVLAVLEQVLANQSDGSCKALTFAILSSVERSPINLISSRGQIDVTQTLAASHNPQIGISLGVHQSGLPPQEDPSWTSEPEWRCWPDPSSTQTAKQWQKEDGSLWELIGHDHEDLVEDVPLTLAAPDLPEMEEVPRTWHPPSWPYQRCRQSWRSSLRDQQWLMDQPSDRLLVKLRKADLMSFHSGEVNIAVYVCLRLLSCGHLCSRAKPC